MPNEMIKALNDITRTLIDSCKGYETCREMAGESHILQKEFDRREQERRELVTDFQVRVRALGGDPVMDGSLSGAAHRGFTKVAALFKDNETAAIDALDDGEEFLIERIQHKLDEVSFTPGTTLLMQRALASAKAGERFADIMEHRASLS